MNIGLPRLEQAEVTAIKRSDVDLDAGLIFIVRADKSRLRLWNWNPRFDPADTPEDCGARETKLDRLSRIK
jgi:hypothetical protein